MNRIINLTRYEKDFIYLAIVDPRVFQGVRTEI